MLPGQPFPPQTLHSRGGSRIFPGYPTTHHRYMCVHACMLSRVRLFVTLWTVATRLLCPWDSPGKNTGVGCHFLLQGIFLTQGSNPSLASSALAGGSLPLCHLGSPLMIQIYDFGFWKNPMFNLISHFPTSNECQKKRGKVEKR